MHHAYDLVFRFLMSLIFSSFTVSINNYSAFITTGLFSYYRIMIMFLNLNLSSPAFLKLQNKTPFSFLFFVTCNVHSNVRIATGYVDSIFKAQCGIIMTSLKLTTTSF